MAWGAIAGALIGGAFSAASTGSTNAANQNLNSANMAWQERMSDTAVQRRVKDLQAAGINPILAAGQSASQPGFQPIPNQSNAQGFSQMGQALSDAMVKHATAQKLKADASAAEADAKYKSWITGGDGTMIGTEDDNGVTHWTKAGGAMGNAQLDLIKSNIGVNNENAAQLHQSTQNLMALLPKLQAEATSAQGQATYAAELAKVQLEGHKIANVLSQAKEPEARAQAKFFENLGAGGTQNTKEWIGTALQIIRTFSGGHRD